MGALSKFKEIWGGLDTRGQITLAGSALAVVVVLFMLYSFASKPSYTTLASNLSPADSASVTKALEGAGIGYKLGSGGTSVSVQDSQIAQARVALAQKGVLNGGHVGFEIFDKSNLGATDFQQQVDYQRALEGEIARTIEQIQGVSSADVQLVLPQETLFADQQQKATAAILVNGGSNLDASTVRGIAHLAASSVKGLDPANVTITDETGALLWPQDGSAGGSSADTKMQADELYAAQLSSQINAMLASTLGPNKAIARVHADLNVDSTTIDKVTYAKKGVPLTTQVDNEQLNSKGGGTALPAGVSSNTTPTYAAGSASNGTSNYRHKTGTTTFGVDRTVQHTSVAPGSVNREDVALIVDSSVPAAQVATLQKSVASLAGIVPSRGDTLAVSRVTFAKQTATTTAKAGPLAMLSNPMGIAKTAGAVLASLIFLFMMRRALKRREGEESVAEPTWLRELEGHVPLAELEAAPTRLALPDPSADAREAIQKEVEEIARRQPQAIAVQVNQWMKE